MNDAKYGLRKEIIAMCFEMERNGIKALLVNVSARWDEGLLISPSGLPTHSL